MLGILSAFITAISMATFFGIVWWACSRGRQSANRESAMLPFALPDEFGQAQQDGAKRS
ncbi:CcoQ/FixQ family Cbb3-type cytochrome c oxidase assembly chaperone [Achromobacter sp. LC458]|uniref:cbb3-type cytochrome oxidase subunit 3 n=1 Tax=Achromobacter sp. LC458 TaxID=1120623 RepID=UPI000629EDFE|nr:cytochrome oxidase [Achromobacter sp. LC458]TRM51345.1 CcoQ/FixQ family Cbb3-type cytochrome c oxidase assembly chaperone [Achromobacter sp. LC458]